MSRSGYASAAAVLVGAFVLFGPASSLALVAGADTVTRALGLTIRGWPVLVGMFIAVVVALDVATTAAAIRLHGSDAVRQGSTAERVHRIGSVALVSLAATVAIVGVAVDFVQWGVTHDYLHFLLAGVALLAAVSLAAVRTANAFRDGYAA